MHDSQDHGEQLHTSTGLEARASELTAAAFGMALILFFQWNLSAAEARVLHGHVPEMVDHLAAVERLDPAKQLDLAIGLPLRNR